MYKENCLISCTKVAISRRGGEGWPAGGLGVVPVMRSLDIAFRGGRRGVDGERCTYLFIPADMPHCRRYASLFERESVLFTKGVT
jgi:hypothetical protein